MAWANESRDLTLMDINECRAPDDSHHIRHPGHPLEAPGLQVVIYSQVVGVGGKAISHDREGHQKATGSPQVCGRQGCVSENSEVPWVPS